MPATSARRVATGIDPALIEFEVISGAGRGAFREPPERAFRLLRAFLGD
jgi:hypothetical protein